MKGNWRLALALLVLWGSASTASALQRPEVRYRLASVVDDTTGVVNGAGEIRYRHFGTDTLRSLSLSLGPNAFRPGGRDWPAVELAPSEASGFLRILELRANGVPVRLEYPETPDSSSARLPLPAALGTGDTAVITFRWEARPPALSWRKAREGRRLDLIGWYPRLMDESAGTTVPFPAFATFLVQFDLAADQVIGGTGVAICGDPGWAGAAASPRTTVTLQRDWYRNPRDPAAAAASCDRAEAGRKRVVWYTEQATEVTYALSPDFRYEEGDFLARPVHALYRRGQERTWGAGQATSRTETAMAWTLELSDRYPWPQVTIAEGLGGTGEALPMMLLVEVPSQSAVLSSLGLMITEQMLAGGARVFTVGSAAYQTAWFFEVLGRRRDYLTIEREILDWDLDRLGIRDEPLGPPTSISSCGTVYCRRTEFMSYQLRRWAGSDEAMRNLYRELYTRFLLRPTVPGAFQRTARELISPNPDSLYVHLIRGALYDDAIATARRQRIGGGQWRTRVVVERRAPGLFPQTVWVIADSDTAVTRAVALARAETLMVVTRSRPRRVLLDPNAESHDWNMLNNQYAFGFRTGSLLLAPQRPTADYLDTYFSRRMERARLTRGWAPTVWYNDVGGWTLGGRVRENYLDRFELNELWVSVSTAAGVRNGRIDPDARLRVRNPVWLRAPGWSQALGLDWVEGRGGASVELTRRFRSHVTDSTLRTLTAGVHWLSVTDQAYLDRRFYDDAGTLEARFTGRIRRPGRWPFGLEAGLTGGYGYPNRGSALPAGTYGRMELTASLQTPLERAVRLGARLYAGLTVTGDSLARQRRMYLAGADPYQRFLSPFLRSRGSLLARPGFYYHDPGGAGVRGLDPRVSAPRALGTSLEVEYAVARHAPGSFLSRVAVAAFGDGALADGDLSRNDNLRTVADAGIGLRLDLHLGQTSFQTRFDFPLWVSRPALAQDGKPDAPVGFRWSFSFLPAF